MKLYAARDKKTGKLVSDITSPRKKFWQRRDACVDAINNHKRRSWRDYDLELVVFELVESDYAKGYNEAVENANKTFKNLQAQIAHIKRHVKSDNSDYLTGYISALSAVEGMIEKEECGNDRISCNNFKKIK